MEVEEKELVDGVDRDGRAEGGVAIEDGSTLARIRG